MNNVAGVKKWAFLFLLITATSLIAQERSGILDVSGMFKNAGGRLADLP